jgi:hypothetical protein
MILKRTKNFSSYQDIYDDDIINKMNSGNFDRDKDFLKDQSYYLTQGGLGNGYNSKTGKVEINPNDPRIGKRSNSHTKNKWVDDPTSWRPGSDLRKRDRDDIEFYEGHKIKNYEKGYYGERQTGILGSGNGAIKTGRRSVFNSDKPMIAAQFYHEAPKVTNDHRGHYVTFISNRDKPKDMYRDFLNSIEETKNRGNKIIGDEKKLKNEVKKTIRKEFKKYHRNKFIRRSGRVALGVTGAIGAGYGAKKLYDHYKNKKKK